MPVTATAAIALAAVLDAAVAEPPGRMHPVALFGSVVARIDRRWGPAGAGPVTPRVVGSLVAVWLPVGFAGVAVALVATGAAVDPRLGALAAAAVLFSTTSLRLLLASAREVVRESDADIDAARRALPALAGRDADALDAAHLRSAAVESLAENLADGLVAPLFAFSIVAALGPPVVDAFGLPVVGPLGLPVVGASLALPLAAGAAAWTKAVNTLDSMLGYRSKPIGWAPARLDDLVMWVPARLTAVLFAVVASSPALPLRRRVRALARRPASPNAGWPMATLAALLPARLRKPGAYDLDPGASRTRGRAGATESPTAGALPDVATATDAVRLTRRAGALAFVVGGVIAWF